MRSLLPILFLSVLSAMQRFVGAFAATTVQFLHSSRAVPTLSFHRLLSTSTASNDEHDYEALVASSVTKLERQRKSLLTELENSKKCEEFASRATLIVSNLYQISPSTKTITLDQYDEITGEATPTTIELNRDKFRTAQEEADWLFTKARKMRRGTSIVEALLQKNENSLGFLEGLSLDDENDQQSLIESKLIDISKTPPPKKKQQQQESQSNTYRSFNGPSSENSPTILIGRNRKQNESLSFKIGKKSDFWLHARGCPGAHVIVKNELKKPQGELTQTLQLAADLAIFYSDNRNDISAECSVIHPRHVLKPRGAPLGTVKLREGEDFVIVGFPDNVPQECKDKRAEGTSASGE